MFVPTTYSVRFITPAGVEESVSFDDRSNAWAFMRLVDGAGLMAGFPNPA